MFPYTTLNNANPLSTEDEMREAIKFLLSLLPGWATSPDPFMVQPGHTLEFEKQIAQKVKSIKDKYDPPPPPICEEAMEEDVFG